MSDNYKDKLGEATALFAQAKEIVLDPEADTETKNTVEAILEEARKLKAEAGQLKEITEVANQLKADAESEEEDHEDKTQSKQQGKGTFSEWHEYLEAVWKAGNPNIKGPHDPRLIWVKDDSGKGGHEQKDLAESVGATGGFLVPTEFQATLQSVMGEESIVRSRATKIRMRRRSIQLPVLDQTGTGAGLPHWFGGMQFFWEEEAAEKTETDPNFRQVELVAHKLIGYTRASDELVDDSAISLGDFLSGPMGMAGGIAWMEDFAFFTGTGAGQPLGVINAGATIIEPRLVAGAIGFDDLADMMEDFLPSGSGLWTITQSAMSEIIQLAGPAANPSFIWQPNARDGIPGFILGMPVIWSEKVPLIGNAGDVVLADWRFYLLGDRQSTTIESTKFDRWRFDQTSWRAVHRVDGQPWLSVPLTYQDGTTQVSPFVILGAVGGS